ncbi:MAG: GTPase Era [Acidobacteria bacterium]|nr:GTPase Era [Acidobacteriota bacterium]
MADPPGSPSHRAGFVALVGLPGAGKSTLLNRLVGERLAAVHRKPQTTRRRILGVARRPGLELILLDTPGIHRPRSGLGRAMMRAVAESLGGADAALAVVDGTRPLAGRDRDLLRRLEVFSGPRVIGINKTDAAPQARLEELEGFYREQDLGPVVRFSARNGANVDAPGEPRDRTPGSLVGMLTECLPLSPPLYPDGQITDLPEAFFASEIVRERLLEHLHQAVPHAAAGRIEAYDDSEPLARVAASLLLDRDSQKGIVIGRGGRMLKRIGSEARGRIEKRLGRRVFLDLQVKVRQKWRDNAGILRDLGL